MYVRVTGRLHQFNSHINNVAAHFISIIQDFNELTYHFLETIYTHLTIGKLDIVSHR
jgi:replication factor A2